MSTESEKSVLAACIFNGTSDPIQTLEPTDFFDRNLRKVYHTINRLSLAKATIDLPSVCSSLERGGDEVPPSLVSELSNHISANTDYHVSVLKDRSARYFTARASKKLLANLNNPVESVQDLIHQFVVDVQTRAVPRPVEESSVEKILNDGFTRKQDRRESTGFQRLDYLLEGGVMMGQYTLVTGKTGHGKSTLVNQIILHLCSHDKPVWLGSFEMHPFRTAKNMMKQTGLLVNAKNVDQFVKYTRGKLYIGGTIGILDPDKMALEVEHYITKRGVRFFVIDNLAVMEAMESGERLEKQTRLMQRVLRFCMDHQVHFFLLAHLRKTNGHGVSIEDIAGTSNIGNLADTALMIERADSKRGCDAVIHILKSRTHGFGKTIKLNFEANTQTFKEA